MAGTAATAAGAGLIGATAVTLGAVDGAAQDLGVEHVAVAALALPVALSLWLLGRWHRGVIPLVTSTAVLLLFAPRLLSFSAGTGLISDSSLAPVELASAYRETSLLLSIFSLALFSSLVAAALAWRDRTVASTGGPAVVSWRDVRVGVAVVVASIGAVAGISDGVRLGPSARDFGSGSTVGPLALVPFGPAAAALWLAGKRRISVLLLSAGLVGPVLTGSRQSVLTPLLYMTFAVVGRRRRMGRPPLSRQTLAAMVATVMILMVIAVAVTTERRSVDTTSGGQERESPYQTLVVDQSLLDPLMVAVAREPRPQWFSIYGRVLAIPVPRLLWPEKPLSYDVDFRARNFSQYEGAIPISIAGTAFVSFGWLGLLGAAVALGALSWRLENLLWSRGARSILLGVAALLFLADVVRIGGLYRESLTLILDVAVIFVVTRRVQPVAGRPIHHSPRGRQA